MFLFSLKYLQTLSHDIPLTEYSDNIMKAQIFFALKAMKNVYENNSKKYFHMFSKHTDLMENNLLLRKMRKN